VAKTAAERKAAQRERQKQSGVTEKRFNLDDQEVAMLAENCALRRPGRDPYDEDEYITLLIRKDNAELQAQLAELSKRKCEKCGDVLPGDRGGCVFSTESNCWQRLGWHETKITL